MKYYLIAGEASGDLHGSNLMKALSKADQRAEFRCMGGDLMQKACGSLVKHYREMAFMGLVNVIKNMDVVKEALWLCREDLLSYRPDVLILIDYPGFNMRMAKFAHDNNIRVFYYISPKVWAWKEYRVKSIKKYVDEMFTILPFETEYFRKHEIEVHYSGNPLTDAIENYKMQALSGEQFRSACNLQDKPIVALLSGSRLQEVKNTLPVMIKAIEGNADFQFVVAGVETIDRAVYDKILKGTNVQVLYNQTYNLLNNAHTALVASGTATLETALFRVPQIVLYRVEGGWLTHIIMKNFFLKVKWVSLPNIILNHEAIKEFIQVEMTASKVRKELKRLLYDTTYRKQILTGYNRLKDIMGAAGSSQRAADKMVELLREKYKTNV